MSKIYVVISSSGEYEDYRTWNEKAFANKKKAEEYAKELDKQHNERPSFVTDAFIENYDECYNNLPDWEPYSNEDATSFILSEDYYKWEKEQRDKDTELLIKEMYKKGFLLTKEMINQYEEWNSRSYDNYYDCFVEELELDED